MKNHVRNAAHRRKLLLFSLLAVLCLPAHALQDTLEIYISPQGADSNAGTAAAPVRTVETAQRLAAGHYGRRTVHFLFMDGTHYLPQTIRVTAEMSGTAEHPVVYRAQHPGKAVLSGGMPLQLRWKKGRNGIWSAQMEQAVDGFDQLYVDGVRRPMARYPNIVPGKNVFDAWDLSHSARADSATDLFLSRRPQRWKQPAGAYVHAMHAALWGDMHWVVKGKDEQGNLQLEGGWQNNRPSAMHGVYRIVENVFEELDQPGEWFYDSEAQRLYYYPEKGQSMKKATVEGVRLKHLVEMRGSRERPVEHVSWQGLIFRHSARTFMENREPLLRSDWTIYRGASVIMEGTHDCSVRHCEFDQVGGNAILVNCYNRRAEIYGCYIHDSGANGVAFVGDPADLRSPLFRYGPQNYRTLDRTPGTKGDNYPADCRVEECVITRTGRVEKQTAPVQISMSYHITVAHTSIFDVPRAGINISEGSYGGHVIEFCDVFNTVLETSDHGSFNSWGRDRYWSPDIKTTSREVERSPGLPYLDILAPTILRNNRWRCDHGWDIDLDDGSSCYRIYNNLLLSGGLKLREGYDRIVTNNIIVNNSLHPHVWYANSQDVFAHNILHDAYKEIGMNVCIPADGTWGKLMDANFYLSEDNSRLRFGKNGCDANSISGNPQFVDPSSGDYRVAEGSAALGIGFRNFPMNQFGVTLPQLKAVAKQPAFPQLKATASSTGNTLTELGGCRVKNIETLGEQSATGLKDREGVLVKDVAPDSKWGLAGLKQNDVILAIGKEPTPNVRALQQWLKQNNPTTVTLKIWRNQQTLERTLRLK